MITQMRIQSIITRITKNNYNTQTTEIETTKPTVTQHEQNTINNNKIKCNTNDNQNNNNNITIKEQQQKHEKQE